MRRRRFLLGLGAAAAGASTGLGEAAARPGPPVGRGPPGDPIENADTGETYAELGQAVESAEAGQTIVAELGATFEEDVTVETEDLAIEAAADSRLLFDSDADVRSVEVRGNDAPTVEGADVLLLDARGDARPTVEGDVDLAVVSARGTSAPRIEGDVGTLVLEARGTVEATVAGDVGELVVDARGNATPTVEGEVGTRARGTLQSQPTIVGDVEIVADGVTLEGFDVEPDSVGVDVRAPDPRSVRLANDAIAGASGAADGEAVPEAGVGVRITARSQIDELSVGGERGANVLVDNDVGFLVRDADGGLADVDGTPLLANNRFARNGRSVVPDPGEPDEQVEPVVSAGPPVEVVASERGPGDTVRADLPGVDVDEDGLLSIPSMTLKLASATDLEFALDPDRSVTDADLVEGYEPIDGGAFAIDTPLAEDELEGVRFTFSVDRSAIDDPEQLALHRRSDGEFAPVRTDFLDATPTAYQYVAFAPGFSLFQLTEFATGGVGGAGRRVDGTVALPAEDPVDEAFLRVETSEPVDDFELQAIHEDVTVGDSVHVDLESVSMAELPGTFGPLFRVRNDGDESATIGASTGLARASFVRVPEIEDVLEIVAGLPGARPWAVTEELVSMQSNPFELGVGEEATFALSLDSPGPENQLWVTLGVPTLTEERSGDVYLGSEAGGDLGDAFVGCGNDADAPVMYHRDFSSGGGAGWIPDDADGDGPYLRVPAYLTVNWVGELASDADETVGVNVESFGDGPDGSLIALYDREGDLYEEGEIFSDPAVGLGAFDPEDFDDGKVNVEFDLVFESESSCDFDGARDIVTMDSVYDNVGDLSITADFLGSDNRWAEISGEDQVRVAAEYYTVGRTTDEITEDLLQETFQKFSEGVISAALPGPVTTYRAASAAVGAGQSQLATVAIWDGVDGLTDQPLTPQSLIARELSRGITGFGGGNEDLPEPFASQGLNLGLYGPSLYVSDDPQPLCVDPDVRTLSVEGQVLGGPVVLMGFDPELVPGQSNHGTPEEHAAMVASILDSVTNDGDGILVLGGDPDRNTDIRRYWEDDVASDPRVDESVTFVHDPDAVRSVDFEDYAMIGIVSSEHQIWHGLTDEQNEAIVDRQHDLSTFVNEGGGLLGNTQDGLDTPWQYISPVVDIESVHANNSSIDVTDAGTELGLTQSGMDGWCCYHESFVEDTVPDFLDVLLRNPRQIGNPPAAIGGEEVVVQTAVDLEITGPGYVEAGSPTSFEFALENASDEAGPDVRLEATITSPDGIETGDVELAGGGDLALDDGALTGQLTADPIAFPADLDRAFDRDLTFADTGLFDVQIDVVSDESDESIVRLPFTVRCVGTNRGICGA